MKQLNKALNNKNAKCCWLGMIEACSWKVLVNASYRGTGTW